MSHPHAYTLGVASLQEDDDDICPVCEGECTCNSTISKPAPPPRPSIISPSLSRPPPHPPTPAPSASSSSSFAPLKIKLTVPPNVLARARLASSSTKKPNPARHTDAPAQPPKRRGRPPKAPATPKPKPPPKKFKHKDTIGKPARRAAASDDEYYPAGTGPSPAIRKDAFPTPSLHQRGDADEDANGADDAQSVQFPTFVSAESSSSDSSSSDGDSDSSDFSTDSSIQDEEESFIRDEEQQQSHGYDKARAKRELLGDGAPKRKERRTNWEIRPRKKSVGLSGDEMDVDSDDETEDDDAEEEDDADEEDNEDDDAEVDGEDDSASTTYAGIATGWSEDEESSFDAELFFAGLTDSDSGADGAEARDDDGDETVDEDDDDVLAFNAMALAAQTVFDVTEGWDGSMIFTNGLKDGQGLLDFDFEANAAQLLDAGTSDGDGEDTDVQMSDVDGTADGEDEEVGLEVDSDGETTDEELVDERGLPTARAMRLFRPPTTPCAIDPMSTMSPGPRPRSAAYLDHRDSPKPADILAGRVFMDVSEDEDADDDTLPVSDVASLTLGPQLERGAPRPPMMGTFATDKSDTLRRAVVDGSRCPVPSPFPRHRRRNPSVSWSGRSMSGSRDRSLSLSSLSHVPQFASSPSPFSHLPLSDDPTSQTSDLPLGAPIDLDDVLDASMLDSDPFDPQYLDSLPSSAFADGEASTAEDDGTRHLQNLSRWDRIPMGTFRRTREAGLAESGSELAAYGGIIRSSPFSGMLWQDKGAGAGSASGSPAAKVKGARRRGKRRMDVVISPVILPVRDRDGDRTPTGTGNGSGNGSGGGNGQNGGYTPPHARPRKSTRKEKMLKKKSLMGAAAGGRRHQQQHYHHHGHHPNAKGRAAGSVQRAGFFGGSVPPLSL